MSIAIGNENIKHEMNLGDMQIKIKLVSINNWLIKMVFVQLEEALTTRNKDIDIAEDNNQQLLLLLEKYDQKLDEMQEAAELKEVERMQLEAKLGQGENKDEYRGKLNKKIEFL